MLVLHDRQDKVKAVQYWDTASPYHYVKTEDHPEHGLILIVGGEDHPTGIKPDQYEVGGHQQASCTRAGHPWHVHPASRAAGQPLLMLWGTRACSVLSKCRGAHPCCGAGVWLHVKEFCGSCALKPMPVRDAPGQVRKAGGLGEEPVDVRGGACV